jgi:hypothetical protein
MQSISQAVQAMHLGTVNAMITRLTFRFMLLKRAYTREEFRQLLSQTRFGPIDIREDLIGLELALQRR